MISSCTIICLYCIMENNVNLKYLYNLTRFLSTRHDENNFYNFKILFTHCLRITFCVKSYVDCMSGSRGSIVETMFYNQWLTHIK